MSSVFSIAVFHISLAVFKYISMTRMVPVRNEQGRVLVNLALSKIFHMRASPSLVAPLIDVSDYSIEGKQTTVVTCMRSDWIAVAF